jgi:predicted RNA-binding protein with PIN domain
MSQGAHLLIDGYNVIHAWPSLRGLMAMDLYAAIERLTRDARLIHDTGTTAVTLVFDGQGDAVTIENPGGQPTFAVVYAPQGLSADALIEQMVANGGKRIEMTVVTRDGMIARSVEASGALVITPEAFMDWVKRAEKNQSTDLGNRRRRLDQQWKNNPFNQEGL